MIKSITDVVERQLCSGCGACAYVESNRFYMANTLEYGRRPFVRINPTTESGEGLNVCPGIKLDHGDDLRKDPHLISELFDAWGPVYGVWEGYAADDEIRYAGSSGGAASALALYAIEKGGMGKVLHTAASIDAPYLNETVISKTRQEIIERAGSRYAPASPAEGLGEIEIGDIPSVFIGKPCDVAAAQRAKAMRPLLQKNLGLTIAFFCAGVPSLEGNLELLKRNGIDNPENIRELRYRGRGWPGLWTVRHDKESGAEKIKQMTYADSWGFLQKYRQWRCYICPDHSGEFSDIAVGDPWYRPISENEAGKSLIIARTKNGMEAILGAAETGYIVLEQSDPTLLPRSQPNLLATRGGLWARLLVLRVLGAEVPKYTGFVLFKFWLNHLGPHAKMQSIIGTVKRVFTKRLNKRVKVSEWKRKR